MTDPRMSLAERAYIAIKQKIDTMFFLPGQYVTEAAICAVLQIGRTPVHQALQRLALERKVEIIPRKGVVMLPSPLGNIGTILDARILVEGELARRAAEQASDAEIAQLERIMRGSDRAHGGGAIDAFLAEDRAFHSALGSMGGNTILSEFSSSLHERMERAWYLNYWRTLDVAASHAQHAQVVAAIRARDAPGAAAAMKAHLEALKARFRLVDDPVASPSPAELL